MKPKAFLLKSDKILGAIIKTLPNPIIESTQNVFHDLMSCIIEQQIHYRSTKKTFQKLLDKAHLKELTPSNFEVFESKGLKDTKLSMKKYETIVRILEHWSENELDWLALSDGEVRAELKKIKGVGPWTIDMILLYTLQRPNIFPADDYHLKLIMTSTYQLDAKSRLKVQMKAEAEKWSPQKSLAVLYLLDWKKYKKTNK